MWTSILVCWGEATNIYIYKQEHTVVNSKKINKWINRIWCFSFQHRGLPLFRKQEAGREYFHRSLTPCLFSTPPLQQAVQSTHSHSQLVRWWRLVRSPFSSHCNAGVTPPPLLSLISKVSNNKNLPKATLGELCWEQCRCPRFFYGICWVLVSVLISLKWFVLFLHSCFSVYYVVFRI